MPIYEVQASPPIGFTRGEAILPIDISLPQVLINHLTNQGVAIPQPVSGHALIDTGASISVVDLAVLTKLNIHPIGVANVLTTAGTAQQNLFPARFQIPGMIIDVSAVLGANLSSQGFVALIGRDILSRFIMIYHGPAGRMTLAT
ncbi:MAG: hypothetical protein ACE5IF_05895 [Candidatus Bathyarchaeia archaeon]